MKWYLLYFVLAASVMLTVSSCSEDDSPEVPVDGVEVTACDELQMFQNYIVMTDDEGNFVEHVYGKVLNEADTTIVSIGADNVEEARKIFERWLAFEPNVQETAPNVLTYYPKDEDGEPQGEIYFTPVNDDPTCTARVTYSAETPLRHFKQIDFIPRSLWPENDQAIRAKWETWKSGGITWTCIRPSAEGVPPISVYIDRRSKADENTPEWIWDHWDETGATYAYEESAKAVSEIAMEDWDAFVEHCMPEGKYGEEAYINKKKNGFADGIYVIQLKKAKLKFYTFWEVGVWSYTHHNYIKCSFK